MSEMNMRVVTVQFEKDEVVLLCHHQQNMDPSTEGETGRWMFNTQQFCSMNQLPPPSDAAPEFYAYSEKQRDKMAEKLMASLISARDKVTAMQAQIADALMNALPEQTPEP